MCSDLGIRRVESCESLTLSDRDAPQRTPSCGTAVGRASDDACGGHRRADASRFAERRAYRRIGRARPDVPEPEPSNVVAIGPLAVRGEPLLAVDHPRVAALAELDPTGIGSAPVGLLNHFLRSRLERRTQELYERVVQSFYQLTEMNRDLIERLAPAALGLTSVGVV